MWTADNRPRYNRDKLRYPSDLTDAEWAHIEPLIPPGKPGGGKRRVAIREVINGVMYILSTGCHPHPANKRSIRCYEKCGFIYQPCSRSNPTTYYMAKSC